MKNKTLFACLLFVISLLMIISCAAPEPKTIAQEVEVEEAVVQTVEVEREVVEEAPANDGVEIVQTDGNEGLYASTRSNRMVIKNAEIKLLVENTDIAIDLATQIISDVGGYIVSSRVWYQDWLDKSYKYSTITIGVPSEEFERTLRRLRNISVKVLDENASGQDVTDYYVDLESQSENLEATRDRIRGFLDQATTVEEALEVNKELSAIEGQIEEIKGQMNYLSDRSAYSTITIMLEPELPERPTPTPTPSPTPEAWRPGETVEKATGTLKNTYQVLINIAIWLGVVVIPTLLPIALVLWLMWRFLIKRNKQPRKNE